VPTTVVRPRPLPAGRVRHALAVAEAINAAGLGCRQAAIEPRLPLAGRSSTDPLEKVDCNVGDDSIAISLFESRAALVASLAVLRRGACFVARSQPTNLTYVTHDDWIVYPQHRATARALGERLGATVTTIRC